jgi:hypothetical protein
MPLCTTTCIFEIRLEVAGGVGFQNNHQTGRTPQIMHVVGNDVGGLVSDGGCSDERCNKWILSLQQSIAKVEIAEEKSDAQ